MGSTVGIMFDVGDTIRTPEGKVGRIAAPQSNGGRFDYYRLSAGEMNIAIYTVILEGGKVERWTEAALADANDVIQAGGH